jgi:hypothetical protein
MRAATTPLADAEPGPSLISRSFWLTGAGGLLPVGSPATDQGATASPGATNRNPGRGSPRRRTNYGGSGVPQVSSEPRANPQADLQIECIADGRILARDVVIMSAA